MLDSQNFEDNQRRTRFHNIHQTSGGFQLEHFTRRQTVNFGRAFIIAAVLFVIGSALAFKFLF